MPTFADLAREFTFGAPPDGFVDDPYPYYAALRDRLHGLDAPDLIADFAARIPVEVIGNLLDVPREVSDCPRPNCCTTASSCSTPGTRRRRI